MISYILIAGLAFFTRASTVENSTDKTVQSRKIHIDQLPGENDNALNFIYRSAPSAAIQDHRAIWQAGATAELPWNDSYWPTYRGILAFRYLDKPHVPKSKNWTDQYYYYVGSPAETMISSGQIKKLSPAEKYDLLVGDTGWTVTKHMWGKGQDYFNTHGSPVPTWFGICHGWSAASHMLTPLPITSLNVIGANGVVIPFTPTDIRALQSYLWAMSSPKTHYIGKKCNSSTAPVGADTGVDPACIDNNPMSWHIAVTHRVGRDGDSMVMDSSRNYEVWNFAIDSYFFRYFNPKTLKTYRSWKDAVVTREEFKSDPFRNSRGAETKYLVGVRMDVFYPAAIEPRESTTPNRIYQSAHYTYDLELNENMVIIGGEWHTGDRPDFLWTFDYEAKAMAFEDAQLLLAPPWDPAQQALPADWATLARKAAGRGEVLATIVNTLVEHSKQVVGPIDPGDDEEMDGFISAF